MGKRIVVFLAIILSVCLLFAGCADSGSVPSADVSSAKSDSSLVLIEDSEDETDTVLETEDAEDVMEISTDNDMEDMEDISDDAQAVDVPDTADEAAVDEADQTEGQDAYVEYCFRKSSLLESHYEKHGIEMGFDSAEAYEKAASDVVNNPNALHKTEAEDGDDIYYVEETNEFVVVSTDGYLRTYFLPSSGKKYYDRQ